MNGLLDEWIVGWMNCWMDGLMDGQACGRVDVWITRMMDDRM